MSKKRKYFTNMAQIEAEFFPEGYRKRVEAEQNEPIIVILPL